jgi:hypothetical protein
VLISPLAVGPQHWCYNKPPRALGAAPALSFRTLETSALPRRAVVFLLLSWCSLVPAHVHRPLRLVPCCRTSPNASWALM